MRVKNILSDLKAKTLFMFLSGVFDILMSIFKLQYYIALSYWIVNTVVKLIIFQNDFMEIYLNLTVYKLFSALGQVSLNIKIYLKMVCKNSIKYKTT